MEAFGRLHLDWQLFSSMSIYCNSSDGSPNSFIIADRSQKVHKFNHRIEILLTKQGGGGNIILYQNKCYHEVENGSGNSRKSGL